MQKKTTMTDIAKALGVSQTLVSFVLSGKNDMGISPETKKKVLQTAEKMGYCSKAASKMLRLGRSSCVALVFEKKPEELSALKLIGDINRGLMRYGYSLIVPGDPTGAVDYTGLTALYSDNIADGFIVFGEKEKLKQHLGDNTPITEISEQDTAEEKAIALCENILSCDIDSSKAKSASKKKSPKKSTKPQKNITVREEKKKEAPVRKNNDIWLL